MSGGQSVVAALKAAGADERLLDVAREAAAREMEEQLLARVPRFGRAEQRRLRLMAAKEGKAVVVLGKTGRWRIFSPVVHSMLQVSASAMRAAKYAKEEAAV